MNDDDENTVSGWRKNGDGGDFRKSREEKEKWYLNGKAEQLLDVGVNVQQ